MGYTEINYGLGWLPDLPDFRDFTFETKIITEKKLDAGQKKIGQGYAG